jgi:hypothetical protein
MPSPPNTLLFPESPKSAIFLAIGLLVTAFLALGSHDLATAHLGVPYPDESVVPVWIKYVGQVVRVGTMVYICRLASWYLDRRTKIAAAIIFGILVVLLQETLRVIVVDNIISEGWIDRRWIYLLSARIPNALVYFFFGASAVVIARRFEGLALTIVATLVTAAIGQFLLLPEMRSAAADVNAAFGLNPPPEVYQMPYSISVYKYIYGMFIEPTISAYVIASLLWPALGGSNAKRILTFVLLLLLMRGRIIATGLFTFWLPLDWLVAVAAEGQFLIETLILAALTGWLRILMSSPKNDAHTVEEA